MKRLLIDYSPGCVRTAYTHDGKLRELFIDPTEGASLVGNIYVARVQNILPGRFALHRPREERFYEPARPFHHQGR
jgi:Ribonuclease G/E